MEADRNQRETGEITSFPFFVLRACYFNGLQLSSILKHGSVRKWNNEDNGILYNEV